MDECDKVIFFGQDIGEIIEAVAWQLWDAHGVRGEPFTQKAFLFRIKVYKVVRTVRVRGH